MVLKTNLGQYFGYVVHTLDSEYECYIDNVDSLMNIDPSVYEFLLYRGVQAYYTIAIKDSQNQIIGFIALEYYDKTKADRDKIDKILKEEIKVFETLLAL